MSSPLTITRLQNMLWALRGHQGCGDGHSWPQLQMLLLEDLEPDVAAALLSKVRAELLAKATHQRMLADPGTIGPSTRRLMEQLRVQPPTARRSPQQRRQQVPSETLGQRIGVCDRCGQRFQQVGRGRPRLRCFSCSPPAR